MSLLEVWMEELSHFTAYPFTFSPPHFTPSQSLQVHWEVEPAYLHSTPWALVDYIPVEAEI